MSFFQELDTLDPRNTKFSPLVEVPTPHKVAILVLIQQYINIKNATSEGSLERTERSRNFSMLLLKLIQYPDMSFNDLHAVISAPRFKIDDVLVNAFSRSAKVLFSEGVENIFDFAEVRNIDRMINDGVSISQYSIVGMYVRRVGVVLERLNFPSVMTLYQNVSAYYRQAYAFDQSKISFIDDFKPKYKHCVEASDDETKSMDESEEEEMEDYEDAEYKLLNMLNDVKDEYYIDVDTVPNDRNHNKWSSKQAEFFVKQQSSFLEYNEIKALNPISMDRKVNEILKDNPLNSNAHFLSYMNKLRLRDYFSSMDALHRSFDRSPSHLMLCSENKGFQFFCLNLAVMHAQYNHNEESLNVLKECVMIAQECGDRRCLDLANSWYCFLNNNKIDPFEKSLPDDQDHNSLALAIQFVVKFGAQCCYQPLDLFELLQKTDEINTKNNKLENICDSVSLRAALWSLYGRYSLVSLYSQILLNMSKSWIFGNIENHESVAKVLASQIMWYNLQSEGQLSAVLLDHARERFPRFPIATDWMISSFIISIQSATLRCNWEEATKLCSQLCLLDEVIGSYYLATVLVARRYFGSARILLENILNTPYLDILYYIRCVQLLSYCSINEQHYTAQAIDSLLNALSITVEAHMEFEHAVIDSIVAEILLRFGFPDKAANLLKSCAHIIYINGGTYQKAKTDFALIRYLMAAAKTVEEQKRCFLRGLSQLQRALANFKMLEAHPRVFDVLSFMSINFNKFGMIKERNKYACQFKQYMSEHPTASEYFNMIF